LNDIFAGEAGGAGPPEMAAIAVRQLSPHWINIEPWVQPQVKKRKLNAE